MFPFLLLLLIMGASPGRTCSRMHYHYSDGNLTHSTMNSLDGIDESYFEDEDTVCIWNEWQVSRKEI